jgi:hypothetical protein
MALGSIQPLTEMSTTNISWGGECLVHTANSLTTVMCWLSWNQPPGNLKACTGFAFLLYKPKSIIYIHQLCTSIEKIWKSVHKTLQKSLQLCDGIHESGQWDNVDGQEERSSVCLLCHTGSVRRGISYCRQDIKTSPTRYQKSNYYDQHMMGWVAHWYRQADTWRICLICKIDPLAQLLTTRPAGSTDPFPLHALHTILAMQQQGWSSQLYCGIAPMWNRAVIAYMKR